jgi:hypothetical protein
MHLLKLGKQAKIFKNPDWKERDTSTTADKFDIC